MENQVLSIYANFPAAKVLYPVIQDILDLPDVESLDREWGLRAWQEMCRRDHSRIQWPHIARGLDEDATYFLNLEIGRFVKIGLAQPSPDKREVVEVQVLFNKGDNGFGVRLARNTPEKYKESIFVWFCVGVHGEGMSVTEYLQTQAVSPT